MSYNDFVRHKLTHTDTYRHRRTQTDTDRHRQTQTDTARHRRTHTDTDRHITTHTHTSKHHKTKKNTDTQMTQPLKFRHYNHTPKPDSDYKKTQIIFIFNEKPHIKQIQKSENITS